jgi:hypothetical protein
MVRRFFISEKLQHISLCWIHSLFLVEKTRTVGETFCVTIFAREKTGGKTGGDIEILHPCRSALHGDTELAVVREHGGGGRKSAGRVPEVCGAVQARASGISGTAFEQQRGRQRARYARRI